MHKIWLIMMLLLSLFPISQLGAQSDLPLAHEETSSQSPKPTINASTTSSHEKSPVRQMLDELIFNYETVYFDSARYSLSPAAKQILKRKANWIKSQDPSKQIVIIGHCDRRGSESKNQYLGTLRAHSVKQFLISCGIDKSRVRILSAGETQPLSQVKNETGLDRNRRVEVIVR
jgi:peptidoglycan-associated lipoprotein